MCSPWPASFHFLFAESTVLDVLQYRQPGAVVRIGAHVDGNGTRFPREHVAGDDDGGLELSLLRPATSTGWVALFLLGRLLLDGLLHEPRRAEVASLWILIHRSIEVERRCGVVNWEDREDVLASKAQGCALLNHTTPKRHGWVGFFLFTNPPQKEQRPLCGWWPRSRLGLLHRALGVCNATKTGVGAIVRGAITQLEASLAPVDGLREVRHLRLPKEHGLERAAGLLLIHRTHGLVA